MTAEKLLHRLYYAFNRWRYGTSYGCGRCHHAYHSHAKGGRCTEKRCPCHEYSTKRVTK